MVTRFTVLEYAAPSLLTLATRETFGDALGYVAEQLKQNVFDQAQEDEDGVPSSVPPRFFAIVPAHGE
jgi:hypothetical protein